MRILRLILAALLVATYITFALIVQAWLTAPTDPDLAYMQARHSYSASAKALGYVACVLIYLLAGAVVAGEGVLAALTILIFAGPVVGAFAGFVWSCLIYAFGGGFDPLPAYYGIIGGLIVVGAYFLLVIGACASTDNAQPQVAESSALKNLISRISGIKLGGTIAGNGFSLETTLREPGSENRDQSTTGSPAAGPGTRDLEG